MKKYFKDDYYFLVPKTGNKKYKAYDKKTNKFLAAFGDKRYQQYRDRIGHYSNQNHNSSKRKELYYARHGKSSKKHSSKYFSHKYLWT